VTPRRTLRVARWEATRGVSGVDRRTAVLLAVALLVLAALAPLLVAFAPTPGAGVYRVAVADGDPYRAPVDATPQLRAVDPGANAVASGRADVAIGAGGVRIADTEKGRAALATFRDAVTAYNDRLMASEGDQAAAFPVVVNLTYVERSAVRVGGTAGSGDGSSGASGTTTGATSAGTTSAGTTSATTTSGTTTSATTTSATSETATSATSETAAPDGERPGSGGDGPATPSDITPPFPLRSLLYAFVFLLPLNVVIQAYGSSVIDERIDRRGEPLLVSPASRGDIVVGKALPYFLGAVAVTAVVAAAVGAGVRSVVALLPLAGLFLGVTFLGALFARSYKELTFVTVTVSVGLMAYAFVPAVFTEVHPIAAISPLSVVVRDIRGDPFSLGAFLLATAPVALAAAVCYGLGLGVYREEDLFTQKRLPAKALDALAAPLSSAWRVGLWTAAFVPFVLIAELFAVAALFVVPEAFAIPVVLALVALVEEAAKSLHVYAGFANARFPDTDRVALAVGVAAGVGFFVGEKLLLLTRLVDLPNVAVGGAAFGGVELGVGSLALLVAPLALHVAAATTSALGARRGRRWYALAFCCAVGLHLAYDYAVVSVLG